MEKSDAAKDSTGVCEKIYNAVAGNHAFRAIHRKSGHAQSSIVSNSKDSNQLALHQNPGDAGITRVSVPAKATVAQQKAGRDRVSIEIHLEPPMLTKEEEITAKPLLSSQKSGGATISPCKTESSGHSVRKGDAAKSTTVFVHIHGHEAEVTPKQSKPAFSSFQEGKIKQERAASPNIIVIQGRCQGSNVSPEAEPKKTVTHIPVEGVEANPKSAVPKTMSKKVDHIIHPDKSDNGESKNADHQVPAATDRFSDYIAQVKNKMRTLSNSGEQKENARPAARSATRRDSFDDRVANYINRTRKSIRTPSNVGDT